MNDKILITGGAGFIGSHITERLAEAGYPIKLFDNLDRNSLQHTNILDHPDVTLVQGTILDQQILEEAAKDARIVIHLAAVAGVSNYHKFPTLTLETNLIGTYNLLKSLDPHDVRHVIYLSTSEIFGTEAIDVNEEDFLRLGPPNDKRWTYAGSKIAAEQLLFGYAEENNWTATIIRPFNIYGPRQTGEGAIRNFCTQVLDKQNLKIEGSGTGSRSWCYVDDFVAALFKIVTEPHDGIEVLNIGNPWAISTTVDLAEKILTTAKNTEGFDCASEIELVPMNFTETRVRYPNIEKIKRLYAWTPNVNLDTGLARTFRWFLEHHEKD